MKRKHVKPRSGFTALYLSPWFLAPMIVLWALGAIQPRNFWLGSGLPWWGNALIAAGWAALAAYAILRLARSGIRPLRRELARLARQRPAGSWLNRDEHQAFIIESRYRILLVNRVAEDDVDDLVREPGEGPLSAETYTLVPGVADVIRHDQVILIDPAAGTGRPVPGTPGHFRSAWRLHRTAKTGFGFVTADPAQVAEVVRQLRGSEQMEEGPA